jgi:hypothetical protein
MIGTVLSTVPALSLLALVNGISRPTFYDISCGARDREVHTRDDRHGSGLDGFLILSPFQIFDGFVKIYNFTRRHISITRVKKFLITDGMAPVYRNLVEMKIRKWM